MGEDGEAVQVTTAPQANTADQAAPVEPVVVEAEAEATPEAAPEEQQIVVGESAEVQATPEEAEVVEEAASTEEFTEPAAEGAIPDD